MPYAAYVIVGDFPLCLSDSHLRNFLLRRNLFVERILK